jgi:hypothetical protein
VCRRWHAMGRSDISAGVVLSCDDPGANRSRVFGDEQDRMCFGRLVGEYKELCGAKVYHWVWMGTHYHMVVEVVCENLRGFVGGLQQAYAQYHHARATTVGSSGRAASKVGP